MNTFRKILQLFVIDKGICTKYIHTTSLNCRTQSGRYRITTKKNRPLTYEMANPPHYIGHRKSWNSWNASTILEGFRSAQTTLEDVFIRKFIMGTWHGIVCSEIIIKRQYNTIRISFIITQTITPRKIYFLLGYSEQLLTKCLQSSVIFDLQTVLDKKSNVFKYI